MEVIAERYRSDSDDSLYSDHPSFLDEKEKGLVMSKRRTLKSMKSKKSKTENQTELSEYYDDEDENSQEEEEELDEEKKE